MENNSYQNHQYHKSNQRKYQWSNIDQQDEIFQRNIFEPYANPSRNQLTQRKVSMKPKITTDSHNIKTQYTMHNQGYKPETRRNKTMLISSIFLLW